MAMWNKPLQESSPLPLWFQISERLRHSIADGTFLPGDALPSERQINEVFGVSRATSRAALDSLEQDGLIVRKSGKGSIVRNPRVEQPATEMYGFSDDMRRRGLHPSYHTLFAGRVRASKEVGEALEVRINTSVYHSRRVLIADDQPIGLALSWIPLPIFKGKTLPTAHELTTHSLYAWLQQKCGARIVGARETIEAALIADEMAHDLSVVSGSPMLVVRRRSDAIDGTPIEYAILNFRADRYRLHLDTGTIAQGGAKIVQLP